MAKLANQLIRGLAIKTHREQSAGVAKLVYAPALGADGDNPWEFKSPLQHFKHDKLALGASGVTHGGSSPLPGTDINNSTSRGCFYLYILCQTSNLLSILDTLNIEGSKCTPF